MKLFKKIVLLASFVGLLSLSALAATTNANLSVAAHVNAACALSASNTLDFTAYDPTSATDNTASGTFTMTCTKHANATVLLGEGANKGGGSTAAAPIRNMTDGTDTLGYQLYSDAGRTQVWENQTGVPETGTGAEQTITVYGKIAALQAVGAGTYADTVVITLNF